MDSAGGERRRPILLDDSSSDFDSDDSLIAVVAVSHGLFTKHRKFRETTSPNLGSRHLPQAFRRTGGMAVRD
jgi:hypothetical protein